MRVLIIDYGLGNIASVGRAFEECGAKVTVSDNPHALKDADRIVLPGVGSFAIGMANLIMAGWPEALCEALENPRLALLGICLGMQLLADSGEENGDSVGLGLLHGRVVGLQPVFSHERIPHVGWNELQIVNPCPLLTGIPTGSDFYFVHSYHFDATEAGQVMAQTPYCGSFASVVGRGNVFGTQFHPEKSSRMGFQLLKNFLSLPPC